ncbi:App1 family protein [Hanstruepera ponticola]|uniref:App1 family protein n=1 Tax=Hanstruepera ponticola TaxID=2042995 RepID=UPI00177ED740|nr:phosphatase domain-containing protein [Hanstruepera ponticola]
MIKKDPFQIITFQSYGTQNHFYLRGRALEDESINLEAKGWFNLFINSFKRFESDEVKHVAINLRLPNDKVISTTTDEHGYFRVEENLTNLQLLCNSEGWLPIVASYKDVNIQRVIQNENRFPAEMLIPSETSEFGVISDIDDTILHTGVVSKLKWRVLYNTIFKGAFRREPLKGAAEFYHLLHRGKSGKNANPIFYVSHSPWNMYRYLEYFLKKHNFPKGPILLRSMSTVFKRNTTDEKPQKQLEIMHILKTYPDLNFILIGDSGEHDADIYMEIAQSYPNRVKAIYLRSVKHEEKMLRIRGLFESYKTTPVLLVDSSEQAVAHAREHGFIR